MKLVIIMHFWCFVVQDSSDEFSILKCPFKVPAPDPNPSHLHTWVTYLDRTCLVDKFELNQMNLGTTVMREVEEERNEKQKRKETKSRREE